MEDKFMEVLDSCWELTTDELRNLVAQLEGVIEEREEEEEDENNYCVNCGCEKEDYESVYCDECFEEEQERLYGDTDEEEIEIAPLKCVGVRDLKDNNGLKVILMSMEDIILNTYEFDIDIKKLNDMELYNLCYNISNEVYNLYYENNGNLEKEEILNIIEKKLEK